MLTRHDEQIAHHATAFTNVFLHELTATHTDETAVRVVRNGTSKKRLA
jgi:hypothetical protein